MAAGEPMSNIKYTKKDLATFNRLCEGTASPDQVTRITSRITLRKFVEQHGKPKCDAMYAELGQRQKRNSRK
jgi:hypothetical protein